MSPEKGKIINSLTTYQMNGYRISLGIVLSLSKVNYSTLMPGYHEYLLGIRPNVVTDLGTNQ